MDNEWNDDRQPGDERRDNPIFELRHTEAAQPLASSGVFSYNFQYPTATLHIGFNVTIPFSVDASQLSWWQTILFISSWIFTPLMIIWSKIIARPVGITNTTDNLISSGDGGSSPSISSSSSTNLSVSSEGPH